MSPGTTPSTTVDSKKKDCEQHVHNTGPHVIARLLVVLVYLVLCNMCVCVPCVHYLTLPWITSCGHTQSKKPSKLNAIV